MKAQELPERFTEVPEPFTNEAFEELMGNESVVVDMSKNTPLVNWAKQHRSSKKKSRRKIAKNSRRQNRK